MKKIRIQEATPAVLKLGPQNAVAAINLSCTVANEGSFDWQWEIPHGTSSESKMWVGDATRTTILQISRLNADQHEGHYLCRAWYHSKASHSYVGYSTTVLLLQGELTSSLPSGLKDFTCELSCF